MKTILSGILFFAILVVSACNDKNDFGEINDPHHQDKLVLADTNALPQTVALFKRMQALLDKGKMIGHQDATAYGRNWFGDANRSDISDVTGQFPPVVGWELGNIEFNSSRNVNSVSFSDMKRLVAEVHERGGINTFSWHCANIATLKDSWDVSRRDLVKSLLEGGENHTAYLEYLDKAADYILSLKDAEGELIPVILRLYHENTGDWFWWGSTQCKPNEFKELFQMTVSYLRDVRNVHNVLYGYSPSDNFSSEAELLRRYPGDEWVDLIGFDSYVNDTDNAGIARYKDAIQNGLSIITNYTSKANKIPAITETGLDHIVINDYFTQILYPTIKDFKFSYILFWRNSQDYDFYVPYLGHPASEDFNSFTNKNDILLINDIK